MDRSLHRPSVSLRLSRAAVLGAFHFYIPLYSNLFTFMAYNLSPLSLQESTSKGCQDAKIPNMYEMRQ